MRLALISRAKASGLSTTSFGFVRQAQQHEGDERDDDLRPHRVLGGSEEVADLEGLFDPSEEQLDRPAALVKVGDLLRARRQVVGEDAQDLAGFGPHPHLSHQSRHRILARGGEPLGQMSDTVADQCGAGGDRPLFDDFEGRVDFQPGDDAAAGLIQARPPSVIIVAEIEHIGRSRLDRHLLGGDDVVDVGRRHHEVKRLVGVGIVDDVRLGPANAGRKRRPFAAQRRKPHAGGVDQAHAIADLTAIAALQLRHQCRKQAGEGFARPHRVGGGEGRPRNRRATEMIKPSRLALQARLDVAQTPRSAELSVEHRDEVRPRPQTARIATGLMLLHKAIEPRPRNLLQQAMKYAILMPHGVDPFPSPVDSQPSGIE